MSYIYLAQPYSHPLRAVREHRYQQAMLFTAQTLQVNPRVIIHSPIIHWHKFAERYELPKDANFWSEQNYGMLRGAKVLWALMLPGHQKSVGMLQEIEFAKQYEIPIHYKEPIVVE